MIWHLCPDGQWKQASFDEVSDAEPSIDLLPSGNSVGLLVRDESMTRVNGRRVRGGLVMLHHRDEIQTGRNTFYYSSHALPEVAVYRLSGSRPANCPICRGSLEEGVMAVRCPGCHRWFHQIPSRGDHRGLNCWTYSEKCRFCGHPTDLTGRQLWRPDEQR